MIPAMISGIASLRASTYQACRKSFNRIVSGVHAGIVTRGAAPNLNAIPIAAFWACLAQKYGMSEADRGLAMIWAKIEERREKRVEAKRYNIR